jgi:hypothetical protein
MPRSAQTINDHRGEQQPCIARAPIAAVAPAVLPTIAAPVGNAGHGGSGGAPIARRAFAARRLGSYGAPPAAAAAVN